VSVFSVELSEIYVGTLWARLTLEVN
jgi:hypothetical protein